MAIRLWQPKWYKYWCHGLKIYYDTRYDCTDKKSNSVLKTHRGYIIPNDAYLGADPSISWHIFNILSIIIRIVIWLGIIYIAGFISPFLTIIVVMLSFAIFLIPYFTCSRIGYNVDKYK